MSSEQKAKCKRHEAGASSARSARQYKAWGVSYDRLEGISPRSGRQLGTSVARSAGSTCWTRDPGVCSLRSLHPRLYVVVRSAHWKAAESRRREARCQFIHCQVVSLSEFFSVSLSEFRISVVKMSQETFTTESQRHRELKFDTTHCQTTLLPHAARQHSRAARVVELSKLC